MATTTGSSAVTYTQNPSAPVAITIAAGTVETTLASFFAADLRQRIPQALVTVALGVLQEDSGLNNAVNRKDYARLVVNSPATFAVNALAAVVADGVTTYASADQDLINRILAIWDQLAYNA